MRKTRIVWTPEERAKIIGYIAAKIRSREVLIDLSSKRLYGLPSLVSEAQNKMVGPERQRPLNSVAVSGLLKLLRAEMAKEASPAPSLPPPEPPEEEDLSTPPAIPSRLGLNPKFSEALSFVAQEIVKAFGEALGEAIGKHVQDAIYDVRHHLGPRSGFVERSPVPEPSTAAQDFGNLPEKFHYPKVLVLGLLPPQQRTIERSFPNLKFRFCESGTPPKTIRQVAEGCARTFSMVKFIRHNDESLVPSGKLKRVNGGVTDLTGAIMQAFPNSQFSGDKVANSV